MQIREIACDESGYEGEKLVGGETDVFAHAGVLLPVAAAASCIKELRRRIRSPALEYKANHLLREKHRPVLLWLLGPRGPIHGNATVHLIDKTFLVVDTLVGALLEQPAGAARTLYRTGRLAFEPDRWTAFLAAANDLMRSRSRPEAAARLAALHGAIDALPTSEILAALRVAEPAVDRFVVNPRTIPPLDPLAPAISAAVDQWSDGGTTPVAIVHDRQTALTEDRLAILMSRLGRPAGPLVELALLHSRLDPRIQVADFLAGVARKVASYELGGRGDAELVTLLRPYIDPASLWGDERSWQQLVPVEKAG